MSTKDRANRNRGKSVKDGRLRDHWAPDARSAQIGGTDILASSSGETSVSPATRSGQALEHSEEFLAGLEPTPDLPEHDMAHLGIHTVRLPNGVVVAHNQNGPGVPCPFCRGDRDKAAECDQCVGRGLVNNVPFCDREWDLVATHPQSGAALWLGGHDAQPGGGDCKPRDRFGLVVSLYNRTGHEPDAGVEHLSHKMMDGPLQDEDIAKVDELAQAVVDRSRRGHDVLVRCQAGMNRSGLVMGVAMVKLGWRADDAIEEMRRIRGPWVLFNESFAEHIRATDRAHRLSAV